MTLTQMTIRSYRTAMREAALHYRQAIKAPVFDHHWNSRIKVAMTHLLNALFYRALARKLEKHLI